MKFTTALTTLYLFTSITSALPPQHYSQEQDLSIHRGLPETPESLFVTPRDTEAERIHLTHRQELEKRRGGGGGKGGGGSGGSRGGSSGTIGGRPASSYSFSPASNIGGRTNGGSGTAPSYGGRYAGGAVVPYTAGRSSPTRNVSPYLFGAAAFGFFPGIWLYSVYAYPYYGYNYRWYDNGNRTANVTCLCQEYGVCGCDPLENNANGTDAIAKQVTNGAGTGAPVNSSTVQTIDYMNGTIVSYINGTLDNGTTATGGTDPSNEDQISAAVAKVAGRYGPWFVSAAVVGACSWLV